MKIESPDAAFRRAFGDALYDLRLGRRWTLENMADECGVTYAAYRAWESGRNLPALDNLRRLAKALGMTASELLRAAERREVWAPRVRNKRGKTAQKMDVTQEGDS